METCCSRFTAAEGGARLAAVASIKNTIITEHCTFVATRLLHEDAYKIRGLLSEGRQRSIFLTRASRVAYIAYELGILTDLTIAKSADYEDVTDWKAHLEEKEVIVCTSKILKCILEDGYLSMNNINVLVIDSCHLISTDDDLKYVMRLYKECIDINKPRLLALTYPIFTSINYDNEATNYEINGENKSDLKEINQSVPVNETVEIKDTDKDEQKDFDTDSCNVIDNTTDEINNSGIEKMNNELKDVKIPISDITEDVLEIESSRDLSDGTISCINTDLEKDKDKKDINLGVYVNEDDFEMYEKLGWKIEELEKDLNCEMDLAEDIDGGKRLSTTISKPKEVIIEYSKQLSLEKLPEVYQELDLFMRRTIQDGIDFINEHRYDPSEIYGDELYEEFINIPDPTKEPKHIFAQFLYILNELGPYAADKAAFSLLAKLEKLKIKVPYERHFLLLCMCTTILIKIRGYADYVFSKYSTDWEKIKLFCTPKVIRLTEILEQFRPQESEKIDINAESPTNENICTINESNHTLNETDDIRNETGHRRNETGHIINETNINTSKTKQMLNMIENCDFTTIGNKIEDRVNTYEANLKEIEVFSASDKKISDKSECKVKVEEYKSVRSRQRVRGRPRVLKNTSRVLQNQNPDALCGIMFLREPLMAKILFMLIVDISRCRPTLSYICAQYCAVEVAGGPQECQRQSRKQEDVLKKFRMHECNLLLATPTLEEGIDLPRCNLVLRWDVPPSYRSHALCRSRARAPRSSLALLAEAPEHSQLLLHHLAIYRELDQIVTRKCGCGVQDEPTSEEENYADDLTPIVKAYTPMGTAMTQNTEMVISPEYMTELNKDVKQYIEDEKMNLEESKLTMVNITGLNDNNNIERDRDIQINETERDEYKKSKNVTNEDEIKVERDRVIQTNETERDEEKKSKNVTNEDEIEVERDRVIQTNETERDGDKKSKNEINTDEIEVERNRVIQTNETERDGEKKSKNETNEDDIELERDRVIQTNEIEKNEEKKSKNITNEDEIEVERDRVMTTNETERDSVTKCDSANKNIVDCDINDGMLKKSDSDIASVDLSTAIALINRYCGKLPSDTFTRLAPQWWMEEVSLPDREGNMKTAYICTLRLPLNCPVKYNIVGHPMPSRVLARRMVALQACRILHKSGELDDQLMPIGKENFKAVEVDGAVNNGNGIEPIDPNDSARPGTTKRRQYYYKRTACAFIDCQPIVDTTDEEIESPDSGTIKRNPKPGEKRNTLYAIDSRLWCALPERYNTRGRRLHAPQHARQAIGILMARHRADKLQIPAFPVYTRSGEVRVSVDLAEEADVRLSPRRARLVRRFMRFVFSDVLRVRRRGMKLQSEGSTHNNYYIVPTIKSINEDGTSKVDIDWSFLELIFKHTEEKRSLEVEKPIFFQQEDEEDIEEKKVENKGKGKDDKVKKMDNPLLKEGETFTFDPEKYKEAVVTPWYRNQDQPQFFLVAEICWNLSPDSAFPSATHTTFRDYYSTKYGVTLTQPNQPLLDVDHTSARLNLLTPRYVNRKGVALPVSSERTRRAKRDRLDQKQILVPELCRVHPFAAPLWFATVALPCVLYRINALLIADEIRRAVAIDVGLGIPKIDDTTCPGFQWPPLDFGWSLAEVLSADSDKGDKKKDYDDDDSSEKDQKELKSIEETIEDKVENESGEDREKTINDILQEKEDAENGFEIGTWSNDMASCIPETVDFDEYLEPLPSNLTFCTSASDCKEIYKRGGANWNCPIEKPKQYSSRTFSVADSDCSYMSSDFDTDDSDMNSEGSDEETDASGFCSSKNSNAAMGVRIEYKTAHEAEAVDVERVRRGAPPPHTCELDDAHDMRTHRDTLRHAQPPQMYIEKFRESVRQHEKYIRNNELLIDKDKSIIDLLPDTSKDIEKKTKSIENIDISDIFPYNNDDIIFENGQITLDSVEKNKRRLLDHIKKNLLLEDIKKMNCFSMKDVNIDSTDYINEKLVNVGFDGKDKYKEKIEKWKQNDLQPYKEVKVQDNFDFDYQPELDGHPGPSPSVILQALTMSNANDGINLERLETIGDSFLKFAITAYLYCAHPTVHEGKLSHMRSKQVSNLNLYRLGRGKRLGARMTASKFEPHDNWLPPCHRAPPTLHHKQAEGQEQSMGEGAVDNAGCFIPYNLITQHSIPDKSIADCVEALIGAYLLECGPRGALLFMSWLGIRVLPRHDIQIDDNHPYVIGHKDDITPTVVEKSTPPTKRQQCTSESDSDFDDDDDDDVGDQIQLELGPEDWSWTGRAVGSLKPYKKDGVWYQPIYGELRAPPSPLLRYIEDPEGELEQMLSGYEALERTLQYRFKDRSLLLQALTHASHQKNRLTDCYQRLEFLGDAILDYLITRHLYEDARRHSPGALTDLRSALVNNTIFATLAARHGFHKYFRHMSPGLNEVLTKYVKIQEENGHSISEEHYLIHEDEMEQAEDVEVPKALGDLFESIAGAIFLDSGMSLGAVWRSYVRLMGAELEAFSAAAPKSPVRELLEAEPDTAKFGKPERLADGRRVRVCVEVFGRGAFKGVGRNYRIAKGTAARCALRHLKIHRTR